MEPDTMQKIAIGLSALLLIAALTSRAGANEIGAVEATQPQADCAEYFGCLHYGILTEAQAHTARGHPLFVEPQSEKVSATPDRTAQASRIVAPSRQ
jgi:hypothetical protein